MSEVIEMSSLPELGRLYVRAALRRRQKPTASTGCPELAVKVEDVGVDDETLADYRRICAIVDDGLLPPTYPQVLATPLHAVIVAHRRFPLPAMGLVHLENTVEQRRPITDDERFDLRCEISGWEWDERLGIRFAIETDLLVDDEVVWHSELWALSRGAPEELVDRGRRRHPAPPSGEEPNALFSLITDAPADLGRRYASICRDYNPIHLYPLTARPFGFRRPIIHGMWTFARCWAELAEFSPTEELQFTVQFKKPLTLPSRIWLRAVADGDDIDYECRNVDGDRLFLKGRVRR